MRSRHRKFKKRSNTENYWPSFADVMSTIALVMLFLVMIVFIKNIIISINLDDEKDKLNATRQELDNQSAILDLTQKELENKESILKILEENLSSLEEQLKNSKEEKNSLDQLILILAEKQEQLENIILINTKELNDLRMKLQSISVLRANIFEKVQKSIEATMGEYNDQGERLVVIGDNANLYITESLMFDSGSYAIKESGKELLTQLSEAFETILDDDEIRSYIDSIAVEGHTDSEGSVDFNRELSTKRSTSVLNYIMSSNPSLQDKYGKFFAAAGFSELRPIASNSTPSGMAKNRRIEFSIKIKDDNVQKIIDEYLESAPGVGEDNE